MKKKLRLRQPIKDTLSVLLLISVIVLGGLIMSLRAEQLDNKKSAIEPASQIAQNNH